MLAAVSAAPPSQERLLIVEDDPGIRTLLLAVLRRAPFKIDAVANGAEALHAIAQHDYSVVTLDMLLPGVNGYDVLTSLEQTAPEMLSRVIVLTAVAPDVLRAHPSVNRTFCVLRKPFDVVELLRAVDSCRGVGSDDAGASRSDDPFVKIRGVSASAHAKAAIVGVVDPSRTCLNIVWGFGYPPHLLEQYNRLPLTTPAPMITAVAEERPVWIRSRAEATARYLPLIPVLREQGTHALAAVPVRVNGEVTGAIGWSFASEQPFDATQQELLQRIADQYGSIIAAQA